MAANLEAIRAVVESGDIVVTGHGFRRMQAREITLTEIEEAILAESAEIIEDYPSDERGSSCLILGTTKGGRVLHIHVSYAPSVDVVTTYEPDEAKWIDNRRRRE